MKITDTCQKHETFKKLHVYFLNKSLFFSACCTGKLSIIGGYECSKHSQPWQVHLTKNGKSWCGASVINERWLVSAAHCYVTWVYHTFMLNLINLFFSL